MRSHREHCQRLGWFSSPLCSRLGRASRFIVLLVMVLFGNRSPISTARAEPLISSEVIALALPSREEAQPTRAGAEFCRRLPNECSVSGSEPSSLALIPSVSETLVSINAHVNVAIRPRTDQEHWGIEDRWDYPDDGFGDCEDYQLLKRKLLASAGLPRRAMRMAVVIDEDGAGHAVLMVRTNRGELVLDNKTDAVLPWSETAYTSVKREGETQGKWVSLGGRTSPSVTANPLVLARVVESRLNQN